MFVLVLAAASVLPCQSAKDDFQLLPASEVKALRALLPATDSEQLKGLYGKHLIFYTEEVMPRAYQIRGGFLDAYVNISAKRGEPYGNVNREFPWGHPAGTHACKGVTGFNFVYLPGAIRYWQEVMPRVVERSPSSKRFYRTVDETVTRWRFPEGTTFGEVLLLKDPDGVRRPFDVRVRVKAADGGWRAGAFRPVLTSAELREFLKDEESVDLAAFERSCEVRELRLRNRHADLTVIDRRAAIEEIPELPKAVVTRLLKRPFRSALGQAWITHGDREGFAPTTRAAYGIVPKNYDGGFLAVDSKSCMSCHEGALKRQADDFDMERDWYGRLRGDDAILSFHPADPSCVGEYSSGGFVPRREFVKAGLLRRKR